MIKPSERKTVEMCFKSVSEQFQNRMSVFGQASVQTHDAFSTLASDSWFQLEFPWRQFENTKFGLLFISNWQISNLIVGKQQIVSNSLSSQFPFGLKVKSELKAILFLFLFVLFVAVVPAPSSHFE